MRLVTTHTAFQTHGCVLESKRSALVRVALGTGGFVAARCLHLPGIQSSMRRVAVDTMDGAFLQSMPKRLGKSPLRLLVTVDAKLIRFSRQQMQRLFRLMDAMTIRTSQLVLSVQARPVTRMTLCLRVTFQAALTDLAGRNFAVGKNLGTISCIDVRLPGPVTGLAALVFPALLLACFQNLMRVVAEFLGEVLMASTASG